MTCAIGIDFGTSNSTVGLATPTGDIRMVALEDGHTSIPTCLFFNMEESGSLPVHFGRDALRLYREGHDGRLLRALKSVLGSSLAQEGTLIGYKAFRLLDVLGIFIRRLKNKAEAAAGQPLDTVTVGRPVFFVDDDEKADREAQEQLRSVAREAGFRHIEFQFEPIAAAFAYEATLAQEEVVLIADLGGGTADFSVVRLSPARHRLVDRTTDILANGGIHIGGTDLDRMLSYKGLMPALGLGSRLRGRSLEMPLTPYMTLATWQKINLLYTPRSQKEIAQLVQEAEQPELLRRLQDVVENRKGHALLQCVENAKIALTDHDKVRINAGQACTELATSVTRSQFEDYIHSQLADISRTVSGIIKSAGTSPQTLFFTGGTSMVPAMRKAIIAQIPQARVVDGDPMAAVGKGLAIDAGRRFR